MIGNELFLVIVILMLVSFIGGLIIGFNSGRPPRGGYF